MMMPPNTAPAGLKDPSPCVYAKLDAAPLYEYIIMVWKSGDELRTAVLIMRKAIIGIVSALLEFCQLGDRACHSIIT
jgi:hypothetical protein